MKKFIILLIFYICLVGCQPIQWNPNNNGLINWKYGDLRLLDPIDAAEPNNDLIALYTRFNNQLFQLRIDFLDLGAGTEQDIYIPIDTNPGGLNKVLTNNNDSFLVDLNWDYLIKIPSLGNVVIIDSHFSPVYGMALLITRNLYQDNIVISFNKSTLPISLSQTKIQVLITPSNQNEVADKSEPISIDAPSPASAKVLFAFWNTYSSTTPAQALRSWAGAHTGPTSSRHGLQYLIDAAAQTKSTVFLLDLLTPDTLSALDYLNVLPKIRELADQGILGLADVGNLTKSGVNDVITNTFQINNMALESDFNKLWNLDSNIGNNVSYNNLDLILLVDKSRMLYSNGYFIGDNDYANNYNFGDCLLRPYNVKIINQSSDFSLKCKGLLLSSALSQPASPLVLGGDFTNSILGNPSTSSQVFAYIDAHPWLQIISITDLATAYDLHSANPLPYYKNPALIENNAQQYNLISASDKDVQPKVYKDLLQSPKNQISDLAWQVYTSLTQPASPTLLSLRKNYLGQIGQIIAAAEWAERPLPNEACNVDLDYDGVDECILANNNIFVIIEPDGGYIPFMFAIDDLGIHQIIGPTWEFMVGFSDPSSWEPSLGLRADATQILGAFSDLYNEWNDYSVSLINDSVIFEDNMSMRKTVSISTNGIHIDIQHPTKSPNSTFIPLIVDPWFRYTPGWGDHYTGIKSPFFFQWGIDIGEMVEIHSTNQIIGYAFNDTRSALDHPEDPNYDYLRGHYLPYPMALAEISSSEKYSVDITIIP